MGQGNIDGPFGMSDDGIGHGSHEGDLRGAVSSRLLRLNVFGMSPAIDCFNVRSCLYGLWVSVALEVRHPSKTHVLLVIS